MLKLWQENVLNAQVATKNVSKGISHLVDTTPVHSITVLENKCRNMRGVALVTTCQN